MLARGVFGALADLAPSYVRQIDFGLPICY